MSDFVNPSGVKNLIGQDKIISLPKEKKYIMVTDEKTGTIKGYFPLKEKRLGKDWFAMYQNSALWLAQQKMTGEQSSVLWFLFSQLDFDNYLCVSRKDIADNLKMKPVNVSRAMKVLKEKNIIVEGPPAGKFKTYRLNPYIAHKGKNRDKTIIDFATVADRK